jgi:uncharacterized protein (TIGR03067 family)
MGPFAGRPATSPTKGPGSLRACVKETRMRRTCPVVLGVGVLLALAVVAPDAACGDDQDKQQGTWKVTYASVGEKTASDAQRKGMKFVIQGNKLTFVEGGGKKEVVHFSLNADRQPREIDFRQKQEGGKAYYHGIYTFETPTRLKLCWGPAGEDRPRGYGTTKNNQRRSFILEKK